MSAPWIAEYVWISGKDTFSDLRSKYKTVTSVSFDKVTLEDMPVWNFDGSSTGQHRGKNTEIVIHPVAMYNHPFINNAKVCRLSLLFFQKVLIS